MQGENERQWKKMWTRTRTTFPPRERVTKKFLEVSQFVQNNGKEMYKKRSVQHVQSYIFAN